MADDKDKISKAHLEKDKETGDTEGRSGQSKIPGEESSDEEMPNELKEVRITLVDEELEVSREQETVEEDVTPSFEVSGAHFENFSIISASGLKPSRDVEEVDRVIVPSQEINPSEDQFRVPVLEEVGVKSIDHSEVKTISPDQKLEEEEKFEISFIQEIRAEKIDHSIDQTMQPQQQSSESREPIELDEEDPVFSWKGGSPYGSGRPKLVIHRSEEEFSTLSFLQVLLRDTYKEIEGGEPGAETVEFVANEPRIPQVQKNIVTLDLTSDAWQSDIRGGKPVIERQDVDIVPKLREVASTLYTGELGYFVVNIPDSYEVDVLQENFFEKLVERISESAVPDEESEGNSFFDILRSSPVVVAEPTISSEEAFFEAVARYFSLDEDIDRFSSVDQVEEGKKQILRRNDWKRVALTERQSMEEESDEHYFWKAAITEGLAWEMKNCFENQKSESRDKQSFENFLQTEILPRDKIQTEKELEGSVDSEGVEADIHVKSNNSWITVGIREFLRLDEKPSQDVVIEFETGRSEGAFNFRKIRESLEKYEVKGIRDKNIYLVLPARVFYRGEKRARMILKLVKSWNEEDQESGLSANVFVPVLDEGYCRGLKSANEFVDSLYGAEEV